MLTNLVFAGYQTSSSRLHKGKKITASSVASIRGFWYAYPSFPYYGLLLILQLLSATMELYWNNEPKIATNIFELGLKSSVFAKDAQYILQYLDFLIRSNNPNSKFLSDDLFNSFLLAFTRSRCSSTVRKNCCSRRTSISEASLGSNGTVRVSIR